MSHFKGFDGNLMDTTPVKQDTRHGGADLSISELSTTPQFRWMGEAAPMTPNASEERNSRVLEQEDQGQEWTGEEESRVEGTVDASYLESLRGGQSAVVDEDEDATQNVEVEGLQTPTRRVTARDDDQEAIQFRDTLRSMNRSIVALNALVRSTIPKFERMQNAIDTWDGLSKQYNKIMVETERTAQILEDPNWPGRDAEEIRYRQQKVADEERREQEEQERQIRLQREEEERAERDRQQKLAQEAKQSVTGVRGRGRGLGRGISTGVPTRTTGTIGRGIPRGSMIGRGHSTSSSVSSSSRTMASTSTRTSSISLPRGGRFS